MRIICTKDYDAMSRYAADRIEKEIMKKRGVVLGLATGTSPLGIYRNLAEDYSGNKISLKETYGFNLDEYKGLGREHKQSFYYYLKKNLLETTDFQKQHLHILNGNAENMDLECEEYEERIKQAGGIDIQILGLGGTGHIGFNEPDDFFPDICHTIRLEEKTIQANARFFDSPLEVPEYAITMGIGTIMRAKKIIMTVSGRGKADILYQALFGPVTPRVPASILQFHPDLTVICDEESCFVIKRKGKYVIGN